MQILPYIYPTTTLIIDDNIGFLEGLDFSLGESLARKIFQSPKKALSYIRSNRNEASNLATRCLTTYSSEKHAKNQEVVFGIELDLIELEISNKERFKEISVVIVDYDMPEMNGIAFCQQIKDTSIKKILFTNVATEKEAIKAFNEGIIDFFLIKNSSTLKQEIMTQVKKLQRDYFDANTHVLNQLLSLNNLAFLRDEAVEQYLNHLLEEKSIEEYYLVNNPSGFLLIDINGNAYRLILYKKDELDSIYNVISTQQCPSHLLAQLKSCSSIPYFWEKVEDFPKGDYKWNDYFYPAKKITGKQVYFVSLLEEPPLDINFMREKDSYQNYLNDLRK